MFVATKNLILQILFSIIMGIVDITEKNFSIEALLQSLKDDKTGAIVTFTGIVRKLDKNKNIQRLDYECYREMAMLELNKIVDSAKSKFDILDISVIHRIGSISPQENVVGIVVTASHREDAFKACSFVIDEIKKSVPIWKKEIL
ncbi:MAG: molybdenum cofactor biosynthesis protein MoaE [Thermoplasmata archaeon]